MLLSPATLAQVMRSRGGRMVEISADVQNVVAQLHEIDPDFRVRYSEEGEYFVVYHVRPDGEEYLVCTAQEFDQRIVHEIRRIAAHDYDYIEELERKEAEADRNVAHRHSEQVGEIGQRLGHALRRDRGYDQQRIFVP